MGFLKINPDYDEALKRLHLVTFADFFGLQGVIVSGHRDRHVVRVHLGPGQQDIHAFLKRQHRVSWKERWNNFLHGFGFISKSRREAQTLQALNQAGVACSQVLASGEDGNRQAFVLVREFSDSVDLRVFLKRGFMKTCLERQAFAGQLGRAIAAIHSHGFDHPDLYSKHVLVNPKDGSICLLDWQRSRHRAQVCWQHRLQNLAALDVTLADQLVSRRERLLCLRSYLDGVRKPELAKKPTDWGCSIISIEKAVCAICKFKRKLLQHRRIRELCQPAIASRPQELIWVDGEAMCLTNEFYQHLKGELPEWLTKAIQPSQPSVCLDSTTFKIAGRGRATLVRRQNRPVLCRWLRGSPSTSPEIRQAALLFRLQRYGIVAPRLLAMGQRQFERGETVSFLLSEPPPRTKPLDCWQISMCPSYTSWERRTQRIQLLRATGALLHQMHAAGCKFELQPASKGTCPLVWLQCANGNVSVGFNSIESLTLRHQKSRRHVLADLAMTRAWLSNLIVSRTDELRFVLTYLGLKRLTAAAKRDIRKLFRQPQSTRVLAHPLPCRAGGPAIA